jgi:glycine cleavage system regulatory protein
MARSLVMTVLGPDRPGLVRALSDSVAEHGGNWLESRMARLAGHFAGIVRVECAVGGVEALLDSLRALAGSGLQVHVAQEEIAPPAPQKTLIVEVVGNDRPGIVRELAAAIAQAGGNVEELVTNLESAAMAGHPLFRARGVVALADSAAPGELVEAIEQLGGDLTVDISIQGA